MTAPLIIHDQRDRADQQEIVMMLADFSFTSPEEIFANLKKAAPMAGMAGSATSNWSATIRCHVPSRAMW